MSYNLPPGCSVNDIPGWLDVETTLDIICPDCGTNFPEMDVCLSPSQRDVDIECEKCGARWYEPLSNHFATE